MAWAWPQLDYLAALLFALGLCILIVAFVWAVFGVVHNTIGKLPIIGGWIDASSHHIAQRVTSIIGGAAAKIEARIGSSWHQLAREVDHLGREIAAHMGLIATLAQLLPGGGALANLYTLLHTLRSNFGAILHRVEGIGHDVVGRIHSVERGIGADVLPRIRSLEREVARTVEHDIASLRARDRALEREYDALYRWMRSHPWTIVTTPFVGAVSVALGRLGLGWLRCVPLRQTGKRIGCAGFQLLEDLLFGVIDVLVIADLCRLTGVMIDVAESSVIQDALGGIIGGIDGLLLCQGVTRPDVLGGYWTDPPPPQAFSVLPVV